MPFLVSNQGIALRFLLFFSMNTNADIPIFIVAALAFILVIIAASLLTRGAIELRPVRAFVFYFLLVGPAAQLLQPSFFF